MNVFTFSSNNLDLHLLICKKFNKRQFHAVKSLFIFDI